VLTYGKEQIKWRRSKVHELDCQGYTQHEIAIKLQIAKGTVNSDLTYLRKQAHENLQKHIHETVPEEFMKCMTGMKRTLKQTLEIAESAADPKIKLQAHAIAIDIYKNIMDLTTNGVIVNDALRIIQSKMEYLNGKGKGEEKRLLRDIEVVKDIEDKIEPGLELEEEPKTTNGVF
jgi:hypothetical protein